jgi:hypothetical protein
MENRGEPIKANLEQTVDNDKSIPVLVKTLIDRMETEPENWETHENKGATFFIYPASNVYIRADGDVVGELWMDGLKISDDHYDMDKVAEALDKLKAQRAIRRIIKNDKERKVED